MKINISEEELDKVVVHEMKYILESNHKWTLKEDRDSQEEVQEVAKVILDWYGGSDADEKGQ